MSPREIIGYQYLGVIYFTWDEAMGACLGRPIENARADWIADCTGKITTLWDDPKESKFWEAVGYLVAAVTIIANIIGWFSAMIAGASALVTSLVVTLKGLFITLPKILFDAVVGIGQVVGIIAKSFATFLKLIHFDLLLQAHKLAFTLSAEYRDAVTKLYKKISEVSESIFGDTMTLHLVFQNTRSLVLSASQLIGRDYDIAQVEWLKSFDGMVVDFNERAEIYMEDPEQIFLDMEEWMEREAVDIGGSAMLNVFSGISANLEKIDLFSGDLFKLNEDYDTWKGGESGRTSKAIGLNLAPWELRLPTFSQEGYEKDKEGRNRKDRDHDTRIDGNKEDTGKNTERMDESTVHVSNWDQMEEPERIREEEHQEDISTRPFQRDTDELETVNAEEEQRIKAEVEAIPEPEEKKAVVIKERPSRKIEVVGIEKLRNTWFVGDY